MTNETKNIISTKIKLSIFTVFTLIIVIHNIFIVSSLNFPNPSSDSRLSSCSAQNEINLQLKYDMFDRITSDSVIREFLIICDKLYSDKKAVIYSDLFEEKLIIKSGFKQVDLVENSFAQKLSTSGLINDSKYSLWYNPLIFSNIPFRVISKNPIETDPPLPEDGPTMILFIENSNDCDEIIVTKYNNYAVFIPSDRFSELDGRKSQ